MGDIIDRIGGSANPRGVAVCGCACCSGAGIGDIIDRISEFAISWGAAATSTAGAASTVVTAGELKIALIRLRNAGVCGTAGTGAANIAKMLGRPAVAESAFTPWELQVRAQTFQTGFQQVRPSLARAKRDAIQNGTKQLIPFRLLQSSST